MPTDSNKAGPTTLWRMLKGKNVRTNAGKDLGEIKEVSENYLHLEKGTVRKEKFWIPKYVADAFDSTTAARCLLIDEEESRGKYQNGTPTTSRSIFTRVRIVQGNTIQTKC